MDSSKDSSDRSLVISDLQASPLSVLSKAIKQLRIVFVGNYLERCYVSRLREYRDIIVVDNDEQELVKCLEEIKKIVKREYGINKWLGITWDTQDNTVKNYNLWVELDGIPLGRHWFQLRSVKVKDESIQLHLKYLRVAKHAHEHTSQSISEYTAIQYRELMTYENACGTLQFLSVFVMSLLTVACTILWYLGDYSVKLMHELSGVIKALTPILFGIIDFFSKCVGGLFWLIYMLWRGDSVPTYRMRPVEPYKRRSNNYDRRTICYK